MTHFKTLTLVGAAALMAFSAPSFAQDADMIKDKAVDMAKKKVKSKAKSMATEKAGEMGGVAAEKGVDVGADMMKGKSMKEAAKGAVMDSGKDTVKSSTGMPSKLGVLSGGTAGVAASAAKNMSTEEKMKAGKIMLKGGSAEDAAMAVAKDRAKDSVMDKAKSMIAKETAPKATSYGSGRTYGSGTSGEAMAKPAVQPAPVVTTTIVNCPSGTTAQPNGTCMITGDYQGGN